MIDEKRALILISWSELKTLEWDILNPDQLTNLEINNKRMTIVLFNLDIKKKGGSSITPPPPCKNKMPYFVEKRQYISEQMFTMEVNRNILNVGEN